MESAFELFVEIRAVDHYTSMFKQMAKLSEQYSKQFDATQKKMMQSKAMMAVGTGMAAVGAGMAAGLVKAAESAGKLQNAILGVSTAMKLTKQQQQELTNMSMTQGIQTAFSAVQTANLYKDMSQAGLTNSMIFNKSFSDEFIKFADARYVSTNGQENPDTSVSDAVGMAHTYQLYTVQQLKPFLNTLNAALMHTHTTIDQFANQFRYFSNTASHTGISANSALMDEMFLQRMGVGGNGRSLGSSFNDFLLRMTGNASAAAAKAMQTAGFIVNGHSAFTDAKGNFLGMQNAIKVMSDFNKRFGGNATTENSLLKTIFGIQGMRVAQSLISGKNGGAAEQYAIIQQQVNNSASVDSIQQQYNKSFFGQAKQAQTTFEDLAQVLGQQLLPLFTKILTVTNKITGALLKWSIAHPGLVKLAAITMTVVSAFLALSGTLMAMAGALRFINALGGFSAMLRVVGIAASGAMTSVLPLVAVSYLLYKAWTSNFGGIQQKTQKVLSWFKSQLPTITNGLNKVLMATGFEYTTEQMNRGPNGKQMGWTQTTKFQIPDWTKGLAAAIAAWKAVAVAIKLANSALGQFIIRMAVFAGRVALFVMWRSTIIAIRIATMAWSAAQWALNAAMDANPIGAIIGLIALLSTGIVLLITHWKNVIAWLQKAWQWYKNLGTNIQFVLDLLAPFIAIPAQIIAHWSGIGKFFDNIGNHIKNALHWLGLWNGSSASTPSTPSIPTGSMSTTSHSNVTVNVNGAGDPKTVATHVVKQLGNAAAINTRSNTYAPNKLAPSH